MDETKKIIPGNLTIAAKDGNDAAEQPAKTGLQVAPLPVKKPMKQPIKIFGDIPAEPTQEGPEGIRFDYCNGLRVLFPNTGEYRLVMRDGSSGTCVYNAEVKPGAIVCSIKKYFIPFTFEVFRKGEDKPFFTHEYSAAGKDVMIQLPGHTIGDTVAWFSYVERFQKKHGCRIICSMTKNLSAIFEKQYPEIQFIDKAETQNFKPYACYFLGLYFNDDVDHQPYDFRFAGLHKTCGLILGLEGKDLEDLPPRVDLSAKKTIRGKYVCIAAKASSQPKYWNNPFGWREVIEFLKSNGYRVLCIDKDREHGCDVTWNYMPYGAEDFTGDRPLQERIDLIKNADFFIGLSSGLSWIAWCCKVPVVMISGFTEPQNEFYTPFRVINTQVCHGCWNDRRVQFKHDDFLWCPFFEKPGQKFECTRAITGEHVIRTIKKIPTFRSK